MKIQTLKEKLLTLHLKTMADIVEEALKKAAKENLSPADVLLILAEQEIAERNQKLIKSRITQAGFPTPKTIDAFDFNFPQAINKARVLGLCDLQFVHQKQNIIQVRGKHTSPSLWVTRPVWPGSEPSLPPP